MKYTKEQQRQQARTVFNFFLTRINMRTKYWNNLQ